MRRLIVHSRLISASTEMFQAAALMRNDECPSEIGALPMEPLRKNSTATLTYALSGPVILVSLRRDVL
jgi:hypothetical protein